MSNSMKIEANTVASVHYTGTLPESGEVFDSSEGRDPLSFLVGHNQMIPGLKPTSWDVASATERNSPSRQMKHTVSVTMKP